MKGIVTRGTPIRIHLLDLFLFPESQQLSPEIQWLEDVFPIEIVPFLGT